MKPFIAYMNAGKNGFHSPLGRLVWKNNPCCSDWWITANSNNPPSPHHAFEVFVNNRDADPYANGRDLRW